MSWGHGPVCFTHATHPVIAALVHAEAVLNAVDGYYLLPLSGPSLGSSGGEGVELGKPK